MHDRLNRPPSAKPLAFATRAKEPRASRLTDRPPQGEGGTLRLLDGEGTDHSLAEILAALSADSAAPNDRLREVEDAIRRHWAVLRNLVREHAELSRGARALVDIDRSPPPPGGGKVTMFAPKRIIAAE